MSKISPKNLAQAIFEATKGKSGAELASAISNSAKILAGKRQLGKSSDILQNLQEILDKKEGTVRAKITTAKKLNHEEQRKLENEIKEKYKASSIVSEFFEKEEVLGGIRVEVGDEVLDTTYRNKLQQLEKFLINK